MCDLTHAWVFWKNMIKPRKTNYPPNCKSIDGRNHIAIAANRYTWVIFMQLLPLHSALNWFSLGLLLLPNHIFLQVLNRLLPTNFSLRLSLLPNHLSINNIHRNQFAIWGRIGLSCVVFCQNIPAWVKSRCAT